jgi:XapX domain-containing protein
MDWLLYGKSLVTGLLVGVVFAFVKLPIPAPAVFEGVLAILGIFLGYSLVETFILK